MPEKQKSSKKARAHKESAGTAIGSKPIRLTEVQKINLVNGGMAHHLRAGKKRREADETKAGRAAIELARTSAQRHKEARRAKRAEAKAKQ